MCCLWRANADAGESCAVLDPPKKCWMGTPFSRRGQEGPRDADGGAAHPGVMGARGGGLPRPTCSPPLYRRTVFALVPGQLWGGDGVSRRGRGGFGVFFLFLQLSLGPSLLGGKLFFIYCSLGKLCYC